MFSCADVCFPFFSFSVSGRSSAYGDTTAEGHPVGPGSISSSTGAISTTTGQQEGDGSEGEGEAEGDVHTSNRQGAFLPSSRIARMVSSVVVYRRVELWVLKFMICGSVG